MDISFLCDKCGQKLVVNESGAGVVVPCPSCNQNLTIPVTQNNSPNTAENAASISDYIDDVYEPLSLYRDRFKDEYAKNTADFFEALVLESGVDESANRNTVAVIRTLEVAIKLDSSSSSNWKSLRILTILLLASSIVVLGLFIGHLVAPKSISVNPGILGLLAGISLLPATIYFIVNKINPRIREIAGRIAIQQTALDKQMNEAWSQLSKINRLYDWGMFAKIIQQTVPRLVLDQYISDGRLNELRKSFGWSDDFNDSKSVISTVSGELNGNPFVIAETLDFDWGEKTYYGSLFITWQEEESYTDSDGDEQTRWVTRTQTLTASVTRPAPDYTRPKFVIYGNEAASDLSFSRSPSSLSSSDGGFIDRLRLKSKVKKLEKKSRDFTDDSQFTIMANKEFDALFYSIDRNHEIQYRALFTPLAQQQMVMLLKDKTVGFGDDFHFIKTRMINLVYPKHLSELDIEAAPNKFKNYDLADARRFFNTYSNDFFKHFYFALAPLLTIPLYQQHRSHVDIYKGVYDKKPSFWEHESIANFHGQDAFQHPLSITENILKTSPDNKGNIDVTAHGFRGEERLEYVEMLGGDGNWHAVPVHWTEYLPVQQTTQFAIRETDGLTLQDFEQQVQTNPDWQSFFRDTNADATRVIFRRSIASLLKN